MSNFLTHESYGNTNYYSRLFYDLSFYIIITLILLNIINGIIIDAFAELRDQHAKTEYSKLNICLICDQERWTFEKKGIDYNYHVQNTHNVWHYVYFLIYLNLLERDDANGLESIIQNKYSYDISWFPVVEQEHPNMI